MLKLSLWQLFFVTLMHGTGKNVLMPGKHSVQTDLIQVTGDQVVIHSPASAKTIPITTGYSRFIDSIIDPVSSSAAPKVQISNGIQALRFTPYSSFNNGGLIQPVNLADNTGVSTSFYLPDTTSWSFYTNATERMLIQGDGKIVTSSPLLINNPAPDNESALRVNGVARVDSSISVRAVSDSNGFISLDRNVKSISEPDDGISPYTFAPTGWANGGNIPVLRIRHPLNVTYQNPFNQSIYRDFMIFPYQYGTAIQYNGVVECWVGEWSIHRGNFYPDVEGKGNGQGGILWVGDDNDRGGLRATARNNLDQGGDVTYGELSVEKFAGAGFGDFRLRLPSNQNSFQFVYGERGSTNVIAKISDKGFFIPTVSSAQTISVPEKGQVMFDSLDNVFKGFDGAEWINLSGDNLQTGMVNQSSNGTDFIFTIPHGLGTTPSYFNVIAASADAANISFVTADNSDLIIHYVIAPGPGLNNLTWNWQVKR